MKAKAFGIDLPDLLLIDADDLVPQLRKTCR